MAGFTMPWSARPGERVDLHLSNGEPVRHVRVIGLDTFDEPVAHWTVTSLGNSVCGRRCIEHGSYLAIDVPENESIEMLSFEVLLTHARPVGTLLRLGPLRLDVDGTCLVATVDTVRVGTVDTLPRTWTAVTIEQAGDGTVLRVRSLDPLRLEETGVQLDVALPCGTLLLGTGEPLRDRTLDARFARPWVRSVSGTRSWHLPTLLPDGPIASTGDGAEWMLRAVNLPTFCVTSARWDGSCFDPRFRPDHYDAVHCHSDDLAPLDWPPTHRVVIPDNAGAGIHAFEVESVSGTIERIIFFVRSARAVAPLVFLVPTATYLAYADERLPERAFPWIGTDRGHRFAQANGLLSLYDHHEDGSGVTLVSVRRPRATVRDDYRYPLCGCPHGLPVDLRLLRFCRSQGIAFDLLTDHDLHEDPDALRPYTALMTGSHPEYLSIEMESTIGNFVARGGRLAYLGGNGFAGVVAMRGELMELRRSPTEALRTCDGAVGEQHLALTNEPGGHLRTRGRGEFALLGVAISLMGFERGRPFVRTPASTDPDVAWLFEGVEGVGFGDDGTVLGAAAAYEVDATDPHLGTPAGTRVIARADGFHEGYVADPGRWYEGGDAERHGRRCAEMTYRSLPGGGGVFAASSVAWCGALPDPGAMNDVGRITRNLLRGFVCALPGLGTASPSVPDLPDTQGSSR